MISTHYCTNLKMLVLFSVLENSVLQGFEPMHVVGAYLDETSWTAFQHSTIIFLCWPPQGGLVYFAFQNSNYYFNITIIKILLFSLVFCVHSINSDFIGRGLQRWISIFKNVPTLIPYFTTYISYRVNPKNACRIFM